MLVPLLGVTWMVASHNVTVQIDGSSQDVLTHARTAGELLDRMGVPYTDHDELVPPPETALRDGMVVELVRAREITLLIGGETDTVLVTALNVDDVIEQLRSRRDVTRRSIVRPSRIVPVRSGMTVEVLNPVPVTVVADGRTREVVTDAQTVGGVLSRLGLEVEDTDRVSPGRGTAVEDGLRIVVERVTMRTVSREIVVDHDTSERSTSRLPRGERREVQAGRDGLVQVRERVTVVDGEVESREEIERETLRAAQTRIIEVGTADPEPERQESSPAPQQDAPSSSDSSSSDRSDTGQASYYDHPDEGMTAAHRSLPFGTVVTVTNRANGKSVKVTINDRGPFIEGRIIDLNTPAFEQIAAKSTGVIDVRITW